MQRVACCKSTYQMRKLKNRGAIVVQLYKLLLMLHRLTSMRGLLCSLAAYLCRLVKIIGRAVAWLLPNSNTESNKENNKNIIYKV